MKKTGQKTAFNSTPKTTKCNNTEEILKARNAILEESFHTTLEQLLRKTLDEIEKLTDSEISFFHFVEPDQRTISLQTWSTNTLNQKCKAEKHVLHYPIDKAGVWVECIHKRTAVIHNDYTSLTHKKGLPEGHAPIIRELVVPIFRNKKIVAVLGVGNKKTDYDNNDIQTITQFADLAWDIAENKRSNEILQKNEEKMRAVFDLMEEGMALNEFVFDDKGEIIDYKILEVNAAFERLTHLTREQVIGRNATQIYGMSSEYINTFWKQHIHDKQSIKTEYFDQISGAWSNVTTSVPFQNKFSTIFSVITERKKAEEEIKLNENRLKSLVEILQYKSATTQDFLDYALNEAIKLTGSKIGYIYFYSEEKKEFTLNSWSIGVMEECKVLEKQTIYDLDKTGLWGEAVRQRKPILDNHFQTPGSLKKGQPEGHAPLSRFLTVPVFNHNEIVAVVGVANKTSDYNETDVLQLTLLMDAVWKVVERKNAETSLQKLSHALEQSPVCIVITDTKGNIEYGNQKVAEVTGYSLSEVMGNNPRIFSSGEKSESEYQNLWETISAGKEWFGEFHNKKKNGELYWEFASISPIFDEQGKITNYVAVKEDITGRKQIEQELIKAKEQAVESDKLKSAFLANMSHEIRTPMNGILGFIDLLQNPELTGSEQKQYIEIVNKSGSRLLTTINDIIEISKIEAGQSPVNYSEIDLNEIMTNHFLFFKPEAEKIGISLQLTKGFEKTLRIKTDVNKLNSILTNLIKNALKFTKQGSIEFGYTLQNNEIAFFVKDTGIGISPDRLQGIFNRFEQADIGISRGYEGSGLGLAISRAYAEMLGGKIDVESTVKKGSNFYFTIEYLPVSKIHKSIIEVSFSDFSKKEVGPKTILIAEDDQASFEFLKILLSNKNHRIIHASNGAIAVEICKSTPEIDLILMDLKMPVMDGREATGKIREFNKKVIIIAQTAFAFPEDREKAIAAGCNDYISKPVKRNELMGLIQKYS